MRQKKIHKLGDIDVEQRTAICAQCGQVDIGPYKHKGCVRWRCRNGAAANNLHSYYKNKPAKKETCERCGFVPEHACQLEIHHIDGDRKNNAVNNLQTLCSNCHQYVTHLDRTERKLKCWKKLGAPRRS